MLSKFISLLFPETDYEKIVASLEYLEPTPLAIRAHNNLTALTCARYDNPNVQAAIKVLKKHGSRHSCELLAKLLYDVLLEELADDSIWNPSETRIIPMPISFQRKRDRGFNQMEKVLATLPRALRTHIAFDVLQRTRDDKMQKTLSREERLKNVAGSFTVIDAKKIRDTRIVLVDDVIATGTTMAEAVKTLRETGAEVACVALARA